MFNEGVNLLLIEDEDKSYYAPIKYFNRFMCNQTLHHERKHFCQLCLHSFISAEILGMLRICFKLVANK